MTHIVLPCPYHTLVAQENELLRLISLVDACIAFSPRNFQSAAIFDFRLAKKKELQDRLAVIKSRKVAIETRTVDNMAVVMSMFSDMKVPYKIIKGQVHVMEPKKVTDNKTPGK